MTALEQAGLISERKLSPVELVDHYLDRIERYNPALNAYVTVAGEHARAAALQAEEAVTANATLGPFHGVPIPIKDLFETKGIKSTFSCRALADFIPDQDDNVVTKIKGAGAIMIGKTNTSEFGTVPFTESELNGVCHNPWNTDRTAGGSSGGAGAAVAARLAPVAHGSDGGGSVRIPSSCNGVFGIKPSRGRISAGPRLAEYWHGFSTSGSLARSVADGAALLDVMQGYMTGDPYTAPPPARPYLDEVGRDPGALRIGFTHTSPNEIDIHPDCIAAMEDAARLLESLGHHVVEAAPDGWIEQSLQPQFVQLISTGTAIVDFLPKDQLEPLNRYLIESAHGISSVVHMQALMTIQQWARRIVAWWDHFDVLLTPTLAMPPVENGYVFSDDDPFMALVRSGLFIPFNPPFNVTGQPAVSVPLHWNSEGLPIGVQLAGPPNGEALLIRLSAQLEEARPWRDKYPPLG
jgi:amidase